MAIKKKFDAAVPVQMATSWKDRVQAVADHPQINDSLSSVIRDCIEQALPVFELELGIRELDDLDETELAALGLDKQSAAPATHTHHGVSPCPRCGKVEPHEHYDAPKEDRAKGSFGYGER